MASVAHQRSGRQAAEEKLQVEWCVQGRVVEVKVTGFDAPAGRGGIRGKVKEFSRRSRRRLLEKCARIEWPFANMMVTVTFLLALTEAEVKGVCAEWCRWCARLLEREQNMVYGEVWRDEAQPERSGREGRACWHQHMIWIGVAWVPKELLDVMRAKLRELSGDPRANFQLTRIRGGAKGATAYISKYIAKVEEPVPAPAEDAEGGAAGGGAGKPDGVPYSATGEGRKWGVRRRKYVPWAMKLVGVARFGPGFYRVRRAMRRYWAGIGKRRYVGGLLFVGNALAWLGLMMQLELAREDCV